MRNPDVQYNGQPRPQAQAGQPAGGSKEFSVMKWVFFPALTGALMLIVAYVNLTVFGWKNGAVYVILLLVIFGFSVAINKYTGSKNKKLALAAYCCEAFLVASLIANAAYSLYVMRNMSVADTATTQSQQNLETIGKLKSSRAQRAAVEKMPQIESSSQVFKANEFGLLVLFIIECVIYAISLFVLVGLAQIWPEPEKPEDERKQPPPHPYREEHFVARMSPEDLWEYQWQLLRQTSMVRGRGAAEGMRQEMVSHNRHFGYDDPPQVPDRGEHWRGAAPARPSRRDERGREVEPLEPRMIGQSGPIVRPRQPEFEVGPRPRPRWQGSKLLNPQDFTEEELKRLNGSNGRAKVEQLPKS